MLIAIACIVVAVVSLKTAHLLYLFKANVAVFNECGQPILIRYMMILLPVACFVFFTGYAFDFAFAGLMAAEMCLAPLWYVAHAQYHFFDAKDAKNTQVAKEWLSAVEMLTAVVAVVLILSEALFSVLHYLMA